MLSLPVRGAWIEMMRDRLIPRSGLSLPVRGAWIEICTLPQLAQLHKRRSPCGERGLK